MIGQVGDALDDLVDRGVVQHWWETIYEPEERAFGGPAGMDVAHQLFHADSHGALTYLAEPRAAGRRELSIMLCSASTTPNKATSGTASANSAPSTRRRSPTCSTP